MDDPYDKRIVLYLILMAIVFLIMCFCFGYILGFVKDITYPSLSINECFIYAPRIPYIPCPRVYGSMIGSEELCRIIDAESGFNPNAKNPHSSAKGLGQIIDSTLAFCEKKLGRELNPYNPEDNIACCNYLYKTRGTKDWQASKFIWDK